MPTDLITSSPPTGLVLEQGTGTSVSPLDLPAVVFQAALERRQHNRQVLMAWLRSALLEGVDCGKLHTAGKGRCRYAAQGRPAECPDPSH
jgi:hypothetical protein